MKKKILIVIACVLASLAVLCHIYIPEHEINNTIAEVQNIVENEIKKDDNLSTTEIPERTIEDEENLESQEVENEAFELQGEIAYNGDAKTWSISTGNTPQLTYISQIDSRWRYHSYTSIGDSSQTIGSSGCGVASAAMIIDSIVGNVSVTELADIFVANGYRSANSGTYWSAYRAVADQFDIEYTETDNFNTMINLLKNNNYIIASCGNGLFTSGGHYIVLYGIDGDTIKIYDPYLYSGKFETSTRRNKVTVSGNTVYCSTNNFRKYANYKQFFCYGYNADTTITTNSTDKQVTTETYTRYVATKSSNLNVRNRPEGNIVGSLSKGSKVIVYETSGNWSRIGIDKWVSTQFLSETTSQTVQKLNSSKYTTGKYNVTTNIHVRTGAGINYKAKSYKQLTTNARCQNKQCGNAYYNGYMKGVVCSVTEVNGEWGKTASGWICLSYCKKI
ncbi:MAG: C39 family peptidase [Clostridia bacterium]|nr:C39 family peptidase [Clostridia bacterium]